MIKPFEVRRTMEISGNIGHIDQTTARSQNVAKERGRKIRMTVGTI